MEFKGKKQVIKAVQKLLGIPADGADGPITWNAILSKLSTREKVAEKATIPQRMITLAREQIGVSEVDGTNCGPMVDTYKAATWLDPDKGWPWCAAFICWLVKEAIEGQNVELSVLELRVRGILKTGQRNKPQAVLIFANQPTRT
jgi:hypothetical protein